MTRRRITLGQDMAHMSDLDKAVRAFCHDMLDIIPPFFRDITAHPQYHTISWSVDINTLYESFKEYCATHNLNPRTRIRFKKKFDQMQLLKSECTRVLGKQIYLYRCVRIRPEGEPPYGHEAHQPPKDRPSVKRLLLAGYTIDAIQQGTAQYRRHAPPTYGYL